MSFKKLKERISGWPWHKKGELLDEIKQTLKEMKEFNASESDELSLLLKKKEEELMAKGMDSEGRLINRFLTTKKTLGMWSTPDIPIEFYSEISDETLELPEALSFALSQGSVLQSAREAVIYRMHAGKDDFKYGYLTRTVAIYFRSGDDFFVAFDDDAFENILLLPSRAEEGRRARDYWFVDVNDPLISRAIYRAKNNNRVIQVTDEDTRSDNIKVSECMIGDKTNEYADFMKKHLSRELKVDVLDNSDCSKVSSSKAFIRLVGLRYSELCAYERCSNDCRSHGVQKIFSGNQGWVSYAGLMIFKKLGLNEANVSSYFNAIEAQLKDKKAISLFYAGLGACKDFINRKEELDVVAALCVELANKLLKYDKKHAGYFFSHGISFFKGHIKHPRDLHALAEKYVSFISCCAGTEEKTIKALSDLKDLFDKLGLAFFDKFLIPVAESQTVATFLILDSTKKIYDAGGIQSDADLEPIKHIAKSCLTKANVVLQDIIMEGLDKNIIPSPISKEAEIIKAFIEQAPAYIIDLYPEFRQIYINSLLSERDAKLTALFKNVKEIKEDIFRGELTKKYDESILFSVLYYVFACHDMTVPKENYIRTYNERESRQNDIPSGISKAISFRVSKGAFALKKEQDAVQTAAWNALIKAANEITAKKDFNISALGFALLKACIEKSLAKGQERFISGIYQFSFNHGESLPKFSNDYQTLMSYKEFIGDRVINDHINKILQEAMASDSRNFYLLQNQVLGRNSDFRGLAKALFGVLQSGKNPEQKQEILRRMLQQNGINPESTAPLLGMPLAELHSWLDKQQPNVIDKGTVSKIFDQLYGNEYKTMQNEMEKYTFKKESIFKGSGKTFKLMLSKRKLHCVAAYNMGVCVAPDNDMWNQEDFWPLIIFDEKNDAHGGAILRTIEEDGQKYLVLSVQPASSILNAASPDQIFDKILRAARIIAKKLNYNDVIIPVSSSIHSNRGSIQAVIAHKFGAHNKLTLKREYQFSYSPYSYEYREFYRAGL